MQTSDRFASTTFVKSLRPSVLREPVMSFSPAVHRSTSSKTEGLGHRHAIADLRLDSSNVDGENKTMNAQNKINSCLMREPHIAKQHLQGFSTEISQARSWLRSVSGGEFGSDGPHFSPCKVKGDAESGLQSKPLFKELMNDETDYNAILNMRVTNRTNETAQLRSMTLKLQQATRELMKRREQIAEQACQMDDEFSKREKAYKQQVSSLTSQLTGYRKAADSNRSAAQGTMATLQEVAAERDGLRQQLEEAIQRAEEADLRVEEQLSLKLSETAASVQAQLDEALVKITTQDEELQHLRDELTTTLEMLEATNAKVSEYKDLLEAAAEAATKSADALREEHEKRVEAHGETIQTVKREAEELRESVRALEAEKKKMMVDVDRVKEERLALATSNASVLQELCDVKEKMFHVREENTLLHRQMEDIKNECKRSMDQLKSDLVDELDSLERKNDDMQAREASWGVERDALHAERARLAHERAEAIAQADERVTQLVASYEAQLATAQERYAVVCAGVDAARSGAEQRLAEATALSASVLAAAEERIAQARAEAEERLADLESASQAQRADAEKRYADLAASSEAALADCEQRYAQLVAVTDSERVDAENKYAELAAASESARVDAEKRLAEVADSSKAALAESESRYAEMAASSAQEISALKDEIARIVREGEETSEVGMHAVDVLRDERDALQASLGALASERDALQASLGALASERDALQATLDEAQQRCAELQSDVTEGEAREEAAHAAIQTLIRDTAEEKDKMMSQANTVTDGLNKEIETLQKAMQQLQQQHAALEEQHTVLEQSKSEAEQRVRALETEADSLKSTILSLESTIESLEKDGTQALADLGARLESECGGLREVLQGLEKEVDATRDMLAVCSGERDTEMAGRKDAEELAATRQKEIDSLTDQIRALMEARDTLSADGSKLSERLAVEAAERDALRKKVESMSKQIEDLNSQVDDATRAQRRWEDEKDKLDSTIDTKEAHIQSLMCQIREAASTLALAQEDAAKDIAAIKQQLEAAVLHSEELQKRVAELEEDVGRAREGLSEDERQLAECMDVIRERDAQLVVLTGVVGERDAEVERLTGVVGERDAEVERLTGVVGERDAEVERLTGVVGERDAEVERLTGVVGERDAEVERLTGVVGERDAEVERLTGVVGERDAEVERLTGVVGERDAEVERLTGVVGERDAEVERLTGVVGERDAEVERLTDVVGERDAEVERLTGVVGERDAEVERLTGVVGERDAEVATLTASVSEREAQINHLNECLEKETAEGTRITQALDQATDENTKAREDIMKLSDEVAKANEEIEHVRDQNAKLSDEVAKSKDENSKLCEEKEKAKQEILQARDDKAKVHDENVKLSEEVAKVKEDISQARDENAKVKEVNARAKDENNKMKDENVRLCSDVVALKSKIESLEERSAEAKTALAVVSSQLEGKIEALDAALRERDEARKEEVRVRDALAAKAEEWQTKIDEKDQQASSAMRTVAQMQEMMVARTKQLEEERDALVQDLARSREEAKQTKYELDRLKSSFHEVEASLSSTNMLLQASSLELESSRAELKRVELKMDEEHRVKVDAVERLAVVEAEYRTYKTVCNTPGQLAEQLQTLVALEADRASAKSRVEAAEEAAEDQKALVSRLRDEIKQLKQKLLVSENARRKLHNEIQELKGNIRVFVRVRPSEQRCVIDVDEEVGTVSVPYKGEYNTFQFDRTFSTRSTQEDMFAEVSSFVQSALDGYNVSLFAYGQTGSGKTHTMFGPHNNQGIIPRSIEQILHTVQQQADNGWSYVMEASFLEIYQEQVRDLLCSADEREGKQYKITQGENGRHDVSDIVTLPIRTKDDVHQAIVTAESNRTIAKTDMNEHSSRSHTVFSLRITGTRSTIGQCQTLHGTLHLVDLAGSERLAKSHATGERLNETKAINKSLSALSDVFVAISKKQSHVPYRNSKLTFLLQPCLSGDGKALVIANLSPIEDSAHESLCTLRFAGMVGSCELGKATKHVNTAGSVKENQAPVRPEPSDVSVCSSLSENMSIPTSRSATTSGLTRPTASAKARESSIPHNVRKSVAPTSSSSAAAATGSGVPASALTISNKPASVTSARAAVRAGKPSMLQTPAKASDDSIPGGKVYGLITPGGTLNIPQ